MRPLALLLLGLAACTAPAVPLPPDHPANPTAPEGPPIVLSPTLTRDAAPGAATPAPAADIGAERHHAH